MPFAGRIETSALQNRCYCKSGFAFWWSRYARRNERSGLLDHRL